MLVSVFDFLGPSAPPPARPARPRLRRAPTNEYRWVREVKGGAFQSRPWVGALAGGSLNLGLFTVARWETRKDAEWAAGRASREFGKRFKPGVSLRAVLESLIRDKLIPNHVLPPRVKQAADGTYFGTVRLPKSGRLIETAPFTCPWLAYAAMCEALARAVPRGRSKSELRAAAQKERGDRLRGRVTLADFIGGPPAAAA